MKTCPKCKETGDIEVMFGYRRNGQAQSWCLCCRSQNKDNVREALQKKYKAAHPGDKANDKRSIGFMKARLK